MTPAATEASPSCIAAATSVRATRSQAPRRGLGARRRPPRRASSRPRRLPPPCPKGAPGPTRRPSPGRRPTGGARRSARSARASFTATPPYAAATASAPGRAACSRSRWDTRRPPPVPRGRGCGSRRAVDVAEPRGQRRGGRAQGRLRQGALGGGRVARRRRAGEPVRARVAVVRAPRSLAPDSVEAQVARDRADPRPVGARRVVGAGGRARPAERPPARRPRRRRGRR